MQVLGWQVWQGPRIHISNTLLVNATADIQGPGFE